MMQMIFQRLFLSIPVILLFIGLAAHHAYIAHMKIVSRNSLRASVRAREEQEEPLAGLRAQRKGALTVMGIAFAVLVVFSAGVAMTVM